MKLYLSLKIFGLISCWIGLNFTFTWWIYSLMSSDFNVLKIGMSFLSQALKKFIPFCLALERHTYALKLSYYYINMLNLQESLPSIKKHLKKWRITAYVSSLVFFLKYCCNQISLMTNTLWFYILNNELACHKQALFNMLGRW